jgi:hypothetical protein
MRAWTVDADDIQLAGDFDAGLLHRTPLIEDFLAPNRDDKFIVVGTKGFGKTLLLKAKRIAYQEAGRLCIPHGSLLDKPVGDKVFRRDMVALYGSGTQAWTKVWLMAIALATVKTLGLVEGVRVNPRLWEIIENGMLHGVIDHFVALLDLSRADLFRCANDTDTQLVPRLRGASAPVAIFIDSVDEYFNKHIQTPDAHASDTGELSPGIWYFSQMALVEVAYQIRRLSHHLKVFAAVRQEAFARLAESTSMVQQYRGSAVPIAYSRASLAEIFTNNIKREKEKNLIARGALRAEPILAFLGRTHVVHTHTGEEEAIFDYICRHTLERPRDLMTVGQKLSAIPAEERAGEWRLKVAVNEAATEIAQEYLNEIAPYLGAIDVARVLAALPGHVVPRAELLRLVTALGDGDRAGDDPPDGPIHLLFRAGLLGWVHVDHVTGRRVQRFLLPGEGALHGGAALPASSHYLVHPVLAEAIARVNPEYATCVDPHNVVGNGRPWRDPETGAPAEREVPYCLARGDIRQFGRLMDDPVVERAVREALRRALETHVAACAWYEIAQGDSFTIADDDPATLVKAVFRVRDDLFDAPGHPELRIAAHYGPVAVDRDERGGVRVAGGAALRLVSRIEPLVRPGEIWATAEFTARLERRPSLYRAAPLGQGAVSAAGPRIAEDGRVNVRKEGSDEPDLWVTLSRIVAARTGQGGGR